MDSKELGVTPTHFTFRLDGVWEMSTPYIFLVAIATATIAAGCDFVQWSGPSPAQDPSNWQQIAYKHDVLGRRVEKKVDGYSTRYVYDGPHVIAEYDGNSVDFTVRSCAGRGRASRGSPRAA